MCDIGRWIVAAVERVIRSAQTSRPLAAHVRSERSPLHDVRQHARRNGARWAFCACADSCLRTSHMAHSRTKLKPMTVRPIGITAGGARRDRTDDLLLAKQALSQLSYGPIVGKRPPSLKLRRATFAFRRLVGLGRFELPTSRLSSARSNQLSYRPK